VSIGSRLAMPEPTLYSRFDEAPCGGWILMIRSCGVRLHCNFRVLSWRRIHS